MGSNSAQSKTLSGIYAEAILPLVNESGNADELVDQLSQVAELLSDQSELAELLDNPLIDRAKRVETANKAFDGQVSELVKDVLCVLVRRGRISLLREITESLKRRLMAADGVATVIVTTAAAIDDTTRETVENQLHLKYGPQTIIDYDIDPELIGGLIIRCGDDVTDLSLRKDFKAMTRRIRTTSANAAEQTDSESDQS